MDTVSGLRLKEWTYIVVLCWFCLFVCLFFPNEAAGLIEINTNKQIKRRRFLLCEATSFWCYHRKLVIICKTVFLISLLKREQIMQSLIICHWLNWICLLNIFSLCLRYLKGTIGWDSLLNMNIYLAVTVKAVSNNITGDRMSSNL